METSDPSKTLHLKPKESTRNQLPARVSKAVKVHLKELKKQLKKKQKLKIQQRKTIKEGLKIELLLDKEVVGSVLNEGW